MDEASASAESGLTFEDEIELSAVSGEYYSHRWFPETCRQEGADFHPDIWELIENPEHRYLSIKVARDGAKTTILRLIVSKRIAFAISRTIVFVGKSEDAAMKSVDWLRKKIRNNHQWRETFRLKAGKQWSASHIEIDNLAYGVTITVIAIGITGSTRGINIDDYRPDLIVVDDPCDEENTNTPEQREKISARFFGALYNSLAPATDQPEAKMALLQTPLDAEDLVEQCTKDPEWHSAAFSIFHEDGTSAWEARYPTATLLEQKQHFIDRGQLHIWMREKEVKVIATEATILNRNWLVFDEPLPAEGVNYIAIDPTPPPKEKGVSSARIARLDNFVIMALRVWQGEIFILEIWKAKAPLPAEWQTNLFRMVRRWRPMIVGIETVLFARTLKYDLEREMRLQHTFFRIEAIEDKRAKPLRIASELSDRGASGAIHVNSQERDFIEEWETYPLGAHDDMLDALAIGCMTLQPGLDNYITADYEVIDQEEQKLLENWRSAP